MCKLKFLTLEKKLYEDLYKKLFFFSKNKNSCLLSYYKKKIIKLDKKINLLNDCPGDVVYFKDIDTYNPYFV